MDTSPTEEVTTYLEATVSDNENICIDEPNETYDGGYCYTNTYQPKHSRLPRNNHARKLDPYDIFISLAIAFVFLWILNYFLSN